MKIVVSLISGLHGGGGRGEVTYIYCDKLDMSLKELRSRRLSSLIARLSHYRVSQKKWYIKFGFLSQKCSVTKWCKIILTKCLCIWGVNFSKLNPIKMPLKRPRAKPVVKNLTARLALNFILLQMKHSDFRQYDRYWLCASNFHFKKEIFSYHPKAEPNGHWSFVGNLCSYCCQLVKGIHCWLN